MLLSMSHFFKRKLVLENNGRLKQFPVFEPWVHSFLPFSQNMSPAVTRRGSFSSVLQNIAYQAQEVSVRTASHANGYNKQKRFLSTAIDQRQAQKNIFLKI